MRYGQHLASAKNDEYRLAQINQFILPDRFPPIALEPFNQVGNGTAVRQGMTQRQRGSPNP